MNNFATQSITERADTDFRWIISHATSSHPDHGPDLIAVRVDAYTVELLREFLVSLHAIVARGGAMVRLQWLGANIEFLREPEDELKPGAPLHHLSEDAPLILAPGADIHASCLHSDVRCECNAFTMLRISERFDPEVFASARIKHTGIEVESKQNLWPLIDAAFPALHATQ